MQSKLKYLLLILILGSVVTYAETQDSQTTQSIPSTQNSQIMQITTPQNTTANDAITFSDPAQPITVKQDAPVFTIRLESNRTTGYSWSIRKMDEHLIKLMSHKYHRPMQQMPGAGGYEEWVFMLKPDAFIKSETTDITMVYARPWEKKKVGKEVTFKVTAQH